MKVRMEQLNALLQQEQAAQKAQSGGEGFEAMLAKELRQTEGGPQGVQPPPPGARAGVISQMLLEQPGETETVDPLLEETLQRSLQQTSSLLDSWNAYTSALSAGGAEGGLKAVYPLLEGLEQQVTALKQGAAPLEKTHAGLAGLINELEVMTTAEKFKFNRGDYI